VVLLCDRGCLGGVVEGGKLVGRENWLCRGWGVRFDELGQADIKILRIWGRRSVRRLGRCKGPGKEGGHVKVLQAIMGCDFLYSLSDYKGTGRLGPTGL